MLEQTLCEGRIAQKIRVFSLFIGKFPLPSPAKLMRRTILTRGATNKTIFTDLPQGYPPLGQFGAEGNIMSTDKLQAIHDTVAEILNEPPSSPHTYFDDEPHDAAQASEQGATASDFLQRATQIPAGGFGKATSGKPGISANEIREGDVVRDAANESSGTARQALAQEVRAAPAAEAGRQPLFKPSSKPASLPSDRQISSTSTLSPAASSSPGSFRAWALRGFTGILLAAGVGAGAFIWLGSSGDAAKTVPSQPAAPIPTAGVSPELTSLLQSISRDLASARKEIDQLKTGREVMARDNTNLSEQLKASQDQLTRTVARLSDQLKASQELATHDNAIASEQIKTIQDQLIRLEHNTPPRIVAAPPRPPAPAARKPVPAASSPQAAATPQATAQPKPAEKPKPSSASRPPAPAPTPAR